MEPANACMHCEVLMMIWIAFRGNSFASSKVSGCRSVHLYDIRSGYPVQLDLWCWFVQCRPHWMHLEKLIGCLLWFEESNHSSICDASWFYFSNLPADGNYAVFQFWKGNSNNQSCKPLQFLKKNSNTQSEICSADKTMLHLLSRYRIWANYSIIKPGPL